ncbi:hypothetical protein [Streptomyces chartreusis]|uniref:hypothetical protein n=1 Tax=Streptomyces chartreusis TaxID=1969 RepID=UPI002E175080
MSSPLDARMRSIAHEVAAEFTDGLPGSNDRTAALEKQLAELTARVDELEKQVAAPAPAAKRTARKTAEPSE